MMRKLFLMLLLWGVFSSSFSQIENLRCEYLTEPIGVDVVNPRFSWEYGVKSKFVPTEYQVQVASELKLLEKGEADVWVSARRSDGQSMAVCYPKVGLKPHARYYWRVVASNDRGKQMISSVASFETGKYGTKDWTAQWISDENGKEFKPSPLFRKKFTTDKKITQARLYVCGLGYYEIWLNGKRVGDHLLDPGYTHFDKRVYYSTYDVTSLLHKGDNVASAVLGNGWMNIQSLAVWRFETARWRKRPLLLSELRIDYSDGTQEVISTDGTWKCSTGAYLFNNLYSGDLYDAREEQKGWREIAFDDSNWVQAKVVEAPAPLLESQLFQPMRAVNEVKPIGEKAFSNKRFVYDFGVNITGFCRLKIKGIKGTKVTIKYGERLNQEGRLDQSNIDVYFQRESNNAPKQEDPNEVFQMDTYVLSGEKEGEEYTPSFTYHGFKYVEIESSAPITFLKEGVTALFVHTDVPQVGRFTCSNDVLNRLWEATNRSYLGNLHSVPTDCPQREKNGWTADAWVAMDLALLNYDGVKLYEKWMKDFEDNLRSDGRLSGVIPSPDWGYADWIGPVWDAALFVVPEAVYNYYGDSRVIEQIYPTCEKYLEYLQSREKEGLVAYGIGDWLPYKTKTPTDFTTACFYYYDYVLMGRFARVLGKDPRPYEMKAKVIREAINLKYFDPIRSVYANGSMTSQALPLYLGIAPRGYEQKIADVLVAMVRENSFKVDFGLLGTKTVPRMLTKYGYIEDAYRMVIQPDEPGWAAWIVKRGLTTLPEQWVLDATGGQSDNHVFFGDISAWMYNALAGINYDANHPGFKRFVIRPHYVKDLQWVKGEYHSVRGMIRSEWKRDKNQILLTVTIPMNTTALVYADKPILVGGGTHSFKFSNQ